MLKRSTSSRIQRSRGVRVKHVLQIAVLLGICFWLLYQVKYSHDKRQELSGKDGKVSSTEEVSSDPLKLGRKDLNPRLEEIHEKNEKGVQEEEEEDDKHDEGEEEREEDTSKTEVDPSEETKKHELEEEQEGGEKEHEVEEAEDTKGDELEDQVRLVGEVDREEDFLDEEKEREEEPSEDKETAEGSEDEEKEREEEPSEDKETAEGSEDEDEIEKHGLVEEENQHFNEDEERDEIDSSTHEAREENYKGDDASSAVTHDNNQLIGLGMGKLDTNFASKSMVATNTSNQFNDEDKNGSKSGGKELEMAEKGLILKETGAENKDNEDGTDAAKVLEDSPPQNTSVSTENNVANVTSSEMFTEDSSSPPPNGRDIVVLHSPQVQNSTVDGVDNSNTTPDGEEADPVLATTNAGSVESSNSTGTDLKPDHKLSSDEKGDGGGTIRLVSTLNNTQNQESEESKNELGEIKTG